MVYQLERVYAVRHVNHVQLLIAVDFDLSSTEETSKYKISF